MTSPKPAFFSPANPRPLRCANGPQPTTCPCGAPATCTLNARPSCHPCVSNFQKYATMMNGIYSAR